MADSSITITPDSGISCWSGPDAIAAFHAKALGLSLRLYAQTGLIPTRGVTITMMLRAASVITKKPYKRGAALQASADCIAWAGTMYAALPYAHPTSGATG